MRAALRLGGLLVLVTSTQACGSKTEDAKKVALTPVNLADKEREAILKTRVKDEQGNLVPSDTKIAGILMPRGLTQTFGFEREWYFDTMLPRTQVEKYFRERVSDAQESHPNATTLELFMGKPKDTPDARPVLIRVYPKPGNAGDFVRIYIRQAAPPRDHYPTPAEVEAQMAAHAQHTE